MSPTFDIIFLKYKWIWNKNRSTQNILQFWCNARERSWFVHIVSFVLWSVIHQMHYKPQKVKLQNDESSCTTKSLFLQLHTKFSKHIEILTEDTFQTKTFLFILSYIFPSCNTKCIWLKVGVGDGPLAWSLGLVLVSFSNVLSTALSPSLSVSLSLIDKFLARKPIFFNHRKWGDEYNERIRLMR